MGVVQEDAAKVAARAEAMGALQAMVAVEVDRAKVGARVEAMGAIPADVAKVGARAQEARATEEAKEDVVEASALHRYLEEIARIAQAALPPHFLFLFFIRCFAPVNRF